MSVLLQHPYAAPTLNLTLPNPPFGNAEVLNIKTNYKFAMEGTVRSYKKTPINYKLIMTFKTLQEETCGSITYEEVTDLIDFIETAIGDFIKVTDWDSNVWKVKLLTSPAQFTQQNRAFHEVTLEFEGIKI